MQEKLNSLYEKYKDTRLLLKFETYARWTTASVFPTYMEKTELEGNDITERDYQSTGAILVNNLASKLVQYLFPVSASFFRLKETDKLKKFLRETSSESTDVSQEIANLERLASERLFMNEGYAQLHQLMRILIVTGNALIYRNNGKLTVYSPRNFVVLRDASGTVLDCILKEQVVFSRLPLEAKLLFRADKKEFDTLNLFTRIKLISEEGKPDRYLVYQEIEDKAFGDKTFYHKNLCPYIPVVWDLVNSDSYGHGLVAEYAGDFARLSMLSEASAKYQLDACKVVNLVKPGATADIDALASASCGEYVSANPEEVVKSETGDAAFINAIDGIIMRLVNSLSIAFMYSANVRDAERVTAAEIRMKVAEVDKTLGGVYSKLSEQLHPAFAYLLCGEIAPKFGAAIASGALKIDLLIGTAALGRTGDVERLLQSMQVLGAIVPAAQQVSPRFSTEKIVDMVLLSNNIDTRTVMKSEEEIRAEQQQIQSQMQQLQQPQATGDAVGQLIGGY